VRRREAVDASVVVTNKREFYQIVRDEERRKQKEIFTGQVVVRHAESLGNQYKISLRSSSRPRRSFPTVRNSENRKEEMMVFGDGTGTQKQRKYE
jgi:hypothetical protein